MKTPVAWETLKIFSYGGNVGKLAVSVTYIQKILHGGRKLENFVRSMPFTFFRQCFLGLYE